MKSLTLIVIVAGLVILASGPAIADDGSSTYRLICSSCHESSAAGAPRLDNKAEWQSRIALGVDALYASVMSGKCQLYITDLRTDLSDEAIKTAINYMVNYYR